MGWVEAQDDDDATAANATKELLKKMQVGGVGKDVLPVEAAGVSVNGQTVKPANINQNQEKQVEKAAMDQAILKAKNETKLEVTKQLRDIAEAEKIVKPFIGEVLAQDSAEATKRFSESRGSRHPGGHDRHCVALSERPRRGAGSRRSHEVVPESSRDGVYTRNDHIWWILWQWQRWPGWLRCDAGLCRSEEVVPEPRQPANSAGMIAIGWLCRDGRGVVQDYAEAMKWLQAAAAVGDSWAMYDIALLHPCLNGQGVAGSNKAMKWYQKAAAAGSSMAMNTIGGLYRDGNGVAQDYPAAMKWFRQAAAIGNPTAQTNVGK